MARRMGWRSRSQGCALFVWCVLCFRRFVLNMWITAWRAPALRERPSMFAVEHVLVGENVMEQSTWDRAPVLSGFMASGVRRGCLRFTLGPNRFKSVDWEVRVRGVEERVKVPSLRDSGSLFHV